MSPRQPDLSEGQTVEATRFVVKDASGRPRAILGTLKGSGEPVLLFADEEGATRIFLLLAAEGPLIGLGNPNAGHMSLMVRNNNAAFLLTDDHGNVRMSMDAHKGTPRLMLSGDENSRLAACITEDHQPFIFIRKRGGDKLSLDASGITKAKS